MASAPFCDSSVITRTPPFSGTKTQAWCTSNPALCTDQPISRFGVNVSTMLSIGKPKVFQRKLTPCARVSWPLSIWTSAELEYHVGHCEASTRFFQTTAGGASIQPSLCTNTSTLRGSRPFGQWISGVACFRNSADRWPDSWADAGETQSRATPAAANTFIELFMFYLRQICASWEGRVALISRTPQSSGLE